MVQGKSPLMEVYAGIWRHFKGARYCVLGLARHTETEEELVVYIPMTDKLGAGPAIQVRPYSMWFEDVLVEGRSVPRFVYEGPRR
jgi:hypothetical protein